MLKQEWINNIINKINNFISIISRNIVNSSSVKSCIKTIQSFKSVKILTLLYDPFYDIWKNDHGRFPYIKWFFKKYLKHNAPRSYRSFYLKMIFSEYYRGGRKSCVFNKLYGLNFINQCKIYIFSNSDKLRDEVLYCEGLVRFISGMSYALFICIFIIIDTKFNFLLLPYTVLFLLFILRLKRIRLKEVLTIFDAMAFLYDQRKPSDKTSPFCFVSGK